MFQKQITENPVDAITSKLNNISVEDIDAEDRENPLLCSEYINDIYAYMKVMEKQYAVSFRSALLFDFIRLRMIF